MATQAALSETDVLAYVRAAALALDLPLDAAQAQRVAAHLSRTAALAAPLMQLALPPAHEPAEIYSLLGRKPGFGGREQL